MNKYHVFYRQSRNSGIEHMTQEYRRKSDLVRDMRGNGFRTVIIIKEEDFRDMLNMTRSEFDSKYYPSSDLKASTFIKKHRNYETLEMIRNNYYIDLETNEITC